MLPIRGTRACNPPETHQNHEHQRTPPQTQGEPGPQAGNCNQPGKHKWTTSGGTDSLLWEEEVIDNNCVLTLVSGTVPDHGGTDDATGVPWTGDTIDRVTVNDDVKLAPKGGRLLFSKLPSLTNADVTNLDTKNAEDLYAMFWTDPKLTEIDGLDHWDTSNVTNM
ncbi:MAG: BspA family leucine-rich repeat surface protein, partial [Bifidobacterium sp.]|nr:BspA family leucine-rich repeat surface protein [Bifidobacterium sp.]